MVVLCFQNITYNIRNGHLLRLPSAKSSSHGINSVLFRACLLWNSLPQSVKYSESIAELKTKMKNLEILTVHVFYVDE